MANLNIQRNAKVMATDGEIGRVTHVIVDPQTKEVTDLVIDGDDGDQQIPMSQVADVSGDTVTLRGGRTELQGMAFRRDEYHEVDEDEVRAETTRTAQRGGAPLQDATEDQVQVGGASRPTAEVETQRRDTESPGRLQLREERLRVGKVEEEAGEVEIGKRVVEHTETVNVPLREERVVIERRPGSGTVEGGAITDTNETIEVDLTRERAVAEKETVVTEEVGIRKESSEHTERVSDTVRKEELVVEERGDVKVTGGDANRAREGEYEREQSRRG